MRRAVKRQKNIVCVEVRGSVASETEAEEFDEAKRLKEAIARLESVGAALHQLEEKKRIAVTNEDFDTAKALKAEVGQKEERKRARERKAHEQGVKERDTLLQ